MKSKNELKLEWEKRMQPLVGRKIVGVRWLGEDEVEEMVWDCSAVVLVLDDATQLWPSSDDEGNGPGALFIQPSTKAKKAGLPDVAPVI